MSEGSVAGLLVLDHELAEIGGTRVRGSHNGISCASGLCAVFASKAPTLVSLSDMIYSDHSKSKRCMHNSRLPSKLNRPPLQPSPKTCPVLRTKKPPRPRRLEA
ncbi:Unannotated [Lentimonas sp. CC19]|nr:Unannotated [Lentimonas sp. CC19]CAA6697022.1 Unannotated [Lentimonas sp. CC10]CAA7070591.1 Unannotated [Lentimonas sp. CC11]